MVGLLKEFASIIKILQWRNTNLRRYNERVYVNGLRYLPEKDQKTEIMKVLRGISLKDLASVLKFQFFSDESEMMNMILAIITNDIGEIQSCVELNKKRRGECFLT